jgi:hypothetical protein
MGHANERGELGSGNLNTCRHFGTNPAFAIQSINQLVIAELAVIPTGSVGDEDLSASHAR